jgi:hypothetical protein
MWAVDVSVYDTNGSQNIRFGGEDVVASPEALMGWSEVVDAVVEIDVGSYKNRHGVSASGGSSSTSSFEVLDSATSITSSYDMAESYSDKPNNANEHSPADDPGAYAAHTVESAAVALQTFAAGCTIAFIDLGSTDHCFSRRELFADYTSLPDRKGPGVEGSKFRLPGTGAICQSVELEGTKRILTFEALHTPWYLQPHLCLKAGRERIQSRILDRQGHCEGTGRRGDPGSQIGCRDVCRRA